MRSEEGNTNNSSRSRVPTWTERETNRRRERRRRAIASKIYAGLRAHGKYKLQRHCDNNEVLKALCQEAGWTVEDDGTTYRKGCKPAKHVDVVGCSASASPCSSYQPSPFASYNPSPSSSSFPSPKRSRNIIIDGASDDSLLPWLKNFSPGAANPPNHKNLYMEHYGSISAPVTPPLCSSPSRSPCIKTNREAIGCTFVHSSSTPISAPVTPPLSSSPSWSLMRISREATGCTFLPSSSMPSPDHQVFPDSSLLSGVCTPNGVPTSPTFSLVSSNKFNPFGSARMWTPGHIGLCLPVVPGGRAHVDVQMGSGVCDEFAFGSTSSGTGLLKAWEGERIHGECAPDELELTLGTSKTSPNA